MKTIKDLYNTAIFTFSWNNYNYHVPWDSDVLYMILDNVFNMLEVGEYH